MGYDVTEETDRSTRNHSAVITEPGKGMGCKMYEAAATVPVLLGRYPKSPRQGVKHLCPCPHQQTCIKDKWKHIKGQYPCWVHRPKNKVSV